MLEEGLCLGFGAPPGAPPPRREDPLLPAPRWEPSSV